jgi:hypothetical protein
MEHRKPTATKYSLLPHDYLKMVTDTFSTHFHSGMDAYRHFTHLPFFAAFGEVGTQEIILAVSLMSKEQIAATTVYASVDYDPKASSPTIQDLLPACVDAVANVFEALLIAEQPKLLAQLADESLSALEGVAFEWTEVDSNRHRVYVKIDKTNLALEGLADEWLGQHDEALKQMKQDEENETKKLFVTGPKRNPSDTEQ